MNSPHYSSASPEVLCKALCDVLAVEFDFDNPSELAAAAVLSQKLMENAEMADTLADSIALHSLQESGDATYRRGDAAFGALRKTKAKINGKALDLMDLPSEASTERMPAAGYESSEDTRRNLYAFDVFQGGDLVANRNSSLVFYSPEVLGFAPETATVDWSDQSGRLWQQFLQQAELEISTPPNSPRQSVPDLVKRTLLNVRNKLVSSAEHKAKNYSIVKQRTGVGKTALHVLYDPHTMYVVVTVNEATTLRSKVHMHDIEGFAKDIVDAFGGHKDNAREALSSLRHELSH